MVKWTLFYPPLIGRNCSETGLSPPAISPNMGDRSNMVRATGLEPEQGCPH